MGDSEVRPDIVIHDVTLDSDQVTLKCGCIFVTEGDYSTWVGDDDSGAFPMPTNRTKVASRCGRHQI